MPAELADGLDQGSDLKTIAWLLRPRPFLVERTCGSPAPDRRKAVRLRLQCALDRHGAMVTLEQLSGKLRTSAVSLISC